MQSINDRILIVTHFGLKQRSADEHVDFRFASRRFIGAVLMSGLGRSFALQRGSD
jgi:hypothetical protein